MLIIYFIIGLTATTIGALAGLGGGVIIKPVLDAIGFHDPSTIGILSSFTVLAMAIVSISKKLIDGVHFNRILAFIAIGATIGGVTGKETLEFISTNLSSSMITAVQSLILAGMLIFVYWSIHTKRKLRQFHFKNPFLVIVVGFALGTISSFLGIGGGPINVAVLILLFSLTTKDAAIGSIFIILFSQSAKLISTGLDSGFSIYELDSLKVLIPAGIIGGLIGSHLSTRFTEKRIRRVFSGSLLFIIALNFYNAIMSMI